jgi:hypothetical protein
MMQTNAASNKPAVEVYLPYFIKDPFVGLTTQKMEINEVKDSIAANLATFAMAELASTSNKPSVVEDTTNSVTCTPTALASKLEEPNSGRKMIISHPAALGGMDQSVQSFSTNTVLDQDKCASCNYPASNTCGKFMKVKYCSRDCQIAHRKVHKVACVATSA